MKNIIQVSFSGGRSSAMMAKIMLDNYDRSQLVFTFANTGKELPETLDFVQNCDINWNLGITWIEYDDKYDFRIVNRETASEDGRPFLELLQKRKYLPTSVNNFCTTELKIRPMKKYMISLGYKNWTAAIGIRYDERHRYRRIKGSSGKDRWDYIFPLYDFMITKKEVHKFWNDQKFDLQIPSQYGNCDFCMLKSKSKKINQARNMPERIDWWITQEKTYNQTFRLDYSCNTIKYLSSLKELFSESQIEEPEVNCLCGD